MSFFNQKIEHPGIALIVVFVIAALYSEYGAAEGAAILFGIFAGIVIYKIVTYRR